MLHISSLRLLTSAISFLVPQYRPSGIASDSFVISDPDNVKCDELLERFYKIIGCDNLVFKPKQILYKLSPRATPVVFNIDSESLKRVVAKARAAAKGDQEPEIIIELEREVSSGQYSMTVCAYKLLLVSQFPESPLRAAQWGCQARKTKAGRLEPRCTRWCAGRKGW